MLHSGGSPRCKRACPQLGELKQLRRCSRAIDFTGHQIIPGLAEPMPFSTGRSLSLSQINSSNYSAATRGIHSEPFTPLSRNWNEETLHGCWNHAEVSTREPLAVKPLVLNGAHAEKTDLTEPPCSLTLITLTANGHVQRNPCSTAGLPWNRLVSVQMELCSLKPKFRTPCTDENKEPKVLSQINATLTGKSKPLQVWFGFFCSTSQGLTQKVEVRRH